VFVAVPVPDEVRHRLVAALGAAVEVIPGKVVRPGNWHITLRFLGEIEEVACELLVARLDEAELGESFRLQWGGLGAFPRSPRATVLWIGPDRGLEALTALAAAVDGAVDRAGFPPEERPFNPHLTLSRIRPAADVSTLVEKTPPFGITMEVDRVTVYQSRLGSGGAAYRILEEIPLPGHRK
jgi:2'-5' RNA ligase